MSKYLVIVDQSRDGSLPRNMLSAEGPFSSIKKARAWIKREAEICIAENEHQFEVGRLKDWGSMFHIVEFIGTVRPVPVVTVKVGLTRATDGISNDFVGTEENHNEDDD